MSNWLKIRCITELPIEDIKDIKGIASKDGNIYIRIVREHPYIDIFCNNSRKAKEIYRSLIKELKVVNLEGFKNGK